MPESTQHKLDRVRPPRVQITYDVETLGSIVKTELPFVVGIMADLSGNGIEGNTPDPAPLPLKDRKYVEIDRDNFNTIMEKTVPSVKLAAKKSDGTDATFGGVTLTFSKLEDFNPINVLRSVPALNDKFESRTRLSNLVAKLDGNLNLQKKFITSLDDTAKTALAEYIKVMNGQATDTQTTDQTQASSGTTTPAAADGDTASASTKKPAKTPQTPEGGTK